MRIGVGRAPRAGAVAVVAPNLALGAALFLRLVDEAARLAAAIGGFEPSVLEWHRRSKADRPSGTAREIVRRLVAAALPIDVDEIAVVRSGRSIARDARRRARRAERDVELRLTARDRSGYAAGRARGDRLAAAAPRTPGLHPFDEVVDDDRGRGPTAVGAMA